MSAVLSSAPSSAWPPVAPAVEARFEPMTPERLDAVLATEQSVYSHPWSRRNFADTLAAGHNALCLLAGDELLGYFVAMPGFEEVHLLNITVAPAWQRQGWALVMLDALALWSRGQGRTGCGWKCVSATRGRSRSTCAAASCAWACARATTPPATACAKTPW